MNIRLNNIFLNFKTKIVLDDLTMSFESNKVNCLLGRSGSGKTSILRIIAGVSPEFSGDVYYENENITKYHPKDRNVGWVPQEQLLFPGLDIKGNIEYGLIARGYSKEIRKKRLTEIVKLVGLESLVNRSPERLSGGERQRVALARAMAPEPQVLLMDEPFSSLDAPERDRLSILFKEIQLETGITAIHVTHAAKEAELIGDNIHVLSNGKIEQVDVVSKIFNSPKSVEVARILGISNLVEPNQIEGIDYSAIIPNHAIKLKEGNYVSKVIASTRDSVHVILESGIKLSIENKEGNTYLPGNKININLIEELFYRF